MRRRRSSSQDLSEYSLRTGRIGQQLRDAASLGKVDEIVELVKKHGNDSWIINSIETRIISKDFNKSPLICAIHAGQDEAARALLQAPAIDIKMLKPYYYLSPLSEAAKMNRPEMVKAIAAMPDSDVNGSDWNDNSILTLTLMHCPDALPTLLAVPHLNVNGTDKSKRTTLHIVAGQPASMMSATLLASITQLIHTPNFNINARDSGGRTALMNAVKQKNLALVELLLNAGANYALKNKSHETAFDIARRAACDPVVKLLETFAQTHPRISENWSSPALFKAPKAPENRSAACALPGNHYTINTYS